MTLLSDATNAYLEPLLKKHAAGQPLIWEDLEASHAACSAVLKESDNTFVTKRVQDLHHSQVQAYREAAVKALRTWSQTEANLEPMEETDTESVFVERCVAACTSGKVALPNWHLDAKMRNVVSIEIRRRARAVFAKYHPQESKDAEAAAVSEDGEVDENEDGEMDEDAEADEEDGEVEDSAKSGETPSAQKKEASTNANKRKKKVIVRKKGTTAKQSGGAQQRRGGAANRGRRGGRGGGGAKSG